MSSPTAEEAMYDFRESVLGEFLETGGLFEDFEEHFEEYMDGDIRIGEE